MAAAENDQRNPSVRQILRLLQGGPHLGDTVQSFFLVALSLLFLHLALTSGALNGGFQLLSFLCFFSRAAHTSLFNRLILKPVPFSLPVPGPLPLLVLPIHFQDNRCSRGCVFILWTCVFIPWTCVFIPWTCVFIPQPQACSWGAVRKLLMLHVPLRPGQDQPE